LSGWLQSPLHENQAHADGRIVCQQTANSEAWRTWLSIIIAIIEQSTISQHQRLVVSIPDSRRQPLIASAGIRRSTGGRPLG